MCVVGIAWGAYEVGSGIYDGYQALKVLLDGRASKREKLSTVGLALLGTVLPGGGYTSASRFAKNIDGGVASAEQALEAGARWLGQGYRELAPGVFRSADNSRQFRMTASDLTDARQGPHVHFESIGKDGKEILENSHVRIKP